MVSRVFLVPTTILAQQHYNTLVQRMMDYQSVWMSYPVSDQCRTEENSGTPQKGNLRYCGGTHRVLSSDVKFKNLGLLIVDEEQRFGVAHKEKIKQLKKILMY